MSKFKVGDRVRVHGHPYGGVEQDAEGVIVRRREFTRGPWEVRADNGRVLTFLEGEMTILPTFAVGDRVRIKSGPDNGFSGPDGGNYGKIGDVGVVTHIYDNSVDVKFETGSCLDSMWSVNSKHLEPAPLRIEAGKYYLTRDGRRVGPMRVWDGYTEIGGGGLLYHAPSDDAHEGEYWRADGQNGEPAMGVGITLDLIAEAEAPAPARGNPAAQVDNLADEYGGGVSRKAEPKFKVGDRVECSGQFSFDPSIGTIVGFAKSGNPYVAVEGRDAPWGDIVGWRYHPEQLRLVAPATSGNDNAESPTLIVALIENGQPKPATRPYIHRSREAATAEADRLAGKHKGQEFGVFELVDTRKVDKPVYEHEWQRLAAEGKKIEAIKALKTITGMGLKPAKDAVEYFLDAA